MTDQLAGILGATRSPTRHRHQDCRGQPEAIHAQVVVELVKGRTFLKGFSWALEVDQPDLGRFGLFRNLIETGEVGCDRWIPLLNRFESRGQPSLGLFD